MAHQRLGQIKLVDEMADTQVLRSKELDDPPAHRLCQQLQQTDWGTNINSHAYQSRCMWKSTQANNR